MQDPMKRVTIDNLPAEPLAASSAFYQLHLPKVLEALESGQDVMIIFDAADYTHRAWRLAAVQGLARDAAPARVNAVTGGSDNLAVMEEYLTKAPGVTGQYLEGS